MLLIPLKTYTMIIVALSLSSGQALRSGTRTLLHLLYIVANHIFQILICMYIVYCIPYPRL